jgi:hypothetical protein
MPLGAVSDCYHFYKSMPAKFKFLDAPMILGSIEKAISRYR